MEAFNNPDTLQVTTPSPTEIRMTRTFAVPRQLIFDAFTKPELLRQWLGRPGHDMTVCDVDLRVGGAYVYGVCARKRMRAATREGVGGLGGFVRQSRKARSGNPDI